MDRTERIILTNMCMVYDGTKVLVQDRRDPDWGGITFPGGHVENGESFTDAVIREMWEETGLTVRNVRLCGIKDWFEDDGSRYIVLFYKTDCYSGEIRSSEEGEIFWCELEELPHMNLAYGMDAMLRVFLEDNISEMFYGRDADMYELK